MFQSTPPREGRHGGRAENSLPASFNPRPHARGDPLDRPGLSDITVSIHAPTRGATPHFHLLLFCQSVSIHAPTRGATLLRLILRPLLVCFNPRPHARGDLSNKSDYKSQIVSIHAPTRGATSKTSGTCCSFGVSIHAPTRGATQQGLSTALQVLVSIHAPTRGATSNALYSIKCSVFQSTPPREGRRY